MPAQSTFYDVLDVSPEADAAAIRAAYREKAKESHPDVSDDPDAEAKFKRVTRAKRVLTDPEERARYDRLGHTQYVATTEGVPTDDHAQADPGQSDQSPTDQSSAGQSSGGQSSAGDASNANRTAGAGADSGTHGGSRETGTDTASATGESTAGTGDAWAKTEARPGGASATAAGYATRTEYKEQSFDRVRVPLTPQSLIQIGTMFAFYPLFLLVSVSPAFPTSVNLVVGVCTILVVAYLLSIPEVGMVVFGGWGLLAPVVLTALPGVGVVSLLGIVALIACWVPFGLSALTRTALRT